MKVTHRKKEDVPITGNFFRPFTLMQKGAGGSGGHQASPRLATQLKEGSGEGESLSPTILPAMNQAFNADFSAVKIHRGSGAIDMNRSLRAKAFAHDGGIYFNEGRYQPDTREGKRLLAHELTHVVQQRGKKTPAIQKDDDSNSSGSSGSTFDFDFDLLPPALKLRLGGLMVQADTGEAELSFTRNLVRYRLGYSYGGDLFFGARSGGFSSRLGFNPSDGGVSLGLSQDQFRFGATANPFSSSVGFNLGYGAPLLPMPSELSAPVYGGWSGAAGILSGLPSFSDPLSFYQSQSQNIDAVIGAVRALQPLADPDRRRFGAGLRFSYNPTTGVLVHGGLQWFF